MAVTAWDEGLIAHISFNEGNGLVASDISGRGHAADLVPGASWIDSGAGRGKALLLDDINDYAVVRNSANDELNTKLLTVSAWIRPTNIAVNGFSYIVSKDKDCCENPGQGGYGLRLRNNGGITTLIGEIWLENSTQATYLFGSIAIPLNTEWVHVALTFDGTTVRTYVNGVVDKTVILTVPNTIQASTKDFVIGALASTKNLYHFDGIVDEVRLYNRALDESEIASLFNSPVNDSKVIFYESFDSEVSINQNSGTVGAGFTALNIVPGMMGNGLQCLNGNQNVTFPVPSTFNKNKGAISFWLKPEPEFFIPNKSRFLFQLETAIGASRRTSWIAINNYNLNELSLNYLNTDDPNDINYQQSVKSTLPVNDNPLPQWVANEWHYVAVSWDFTSNKKFLQLEIDGQLFRPYIGSWDMTGINPAFFKVGSDDYNPSRAVIDEFRIYSEPIYDLNNPINSYKRMVLGDGLIQAHETIQTSPADTTVLADSVVPGAPLIVFEKADFEAVMPGTVPDVNDIRNDVFEITYKTATTEGIDAFDINYETLFFNIYSRDDFKNVDVSFTDFVREGSGGAEFIAKTKAKLRVVHNWWQAGTDLNTSHTPVFIPELLLADDRVNLDGTSCKVNTVECDHKILPLLPKPVNSDASTDLVSNTSKQFALILPVTSDLKPGNYVSTVTFSSVETGQLIEITLKLEIQDIQLAATGKDYVITHRANYKKLIDSQGIEKGDFVGVDTTGDGIIDGEGDSTRYEKQLADIRAHGFNSVTLYADYDADLEYLDKIINQGFTGKIIVYNSASWLGGEYEHLWFERSTAALNKMVANNIEPWFSAGDEPDLSGRGVIEWNNFIRNINAIHSVGGYAIGSLTDKSSADILTDSSHSLYPTSSEYTAYRPIDWVYLGASDLSLPANTSNVIDYLNDIVFDPSLKENYSHSTYWQLSPEDPRVHRYRTGYFMWVTNLDGVFPYAYQHIYGNPYNDFDGWNGSEGRRDNFLTYPNADGPVTTIEWEALREGIDDLRYLKTWKYWYDLIVVNNAGNDTTVSLASRLTIEAAMDKYKTFSDQASIDISQFSIDRNIIADQILLLKSTFPDIDTDGDGLIDARDQDDDNDGLSDQMEILIGTNPLLIDSDGDNLSDFFEVNYDGVADTYSSGVDLNPLLIDSDVDGFNDDVEVAENSDPLNNQKTPADGDLNTDGVVNMADLVILTRIVLGIHMPTEREQLHGDVGPQMLAIPVPDGQINVVDVLLLQRKILGLVNF